MAGFAGSAAEQVAVLEWSTATASSTPLASTAIAVKNHGKFLFVFRLGDMASETIDCIVETCDSGGGNNTTLKAATQLAAHASNNDSKVITIAVEENEVSASGRQYLRGKVTTGGATGGTVTIASFGLEPHNGPASLNDNAFVVEVKP